MTPFHPSQLPMFGKKYDPELIVSHLATVLLPSCAAYVTDYINAVRLDETERARMKFSMYLFPIVASYGLALTTTNSKFKTALLKAHIIYLEGFRDREMLVNLGETIVWRIERDAISRELRDRFGQTIAPADFGFHEIRYGTLLGIVSGIRSNAFLTDFSLGMSQAQDNPKLGFQASLNSLGISFTRYVLKIDPNDPDLSSADRDRFQRSVANSILFLGQTYFNVIDIQKSMNA